MATLRCGAQLPAAGAPLVSEHRLRKRSGFSVATCGLSSCGSWAPRHRLLAEAHRQVGSSWVRDRTHVSGIGSLFLTPGLVRKTLYLFFKLENGSHFVWHLAFFHLVYFGDLFVPTHGGRRTSLSQEALGCPCDILNSYRHQDTQKLETWLVDSGPKCGRLFSLAGCTFLLAPGILPAWGIPTVHIVCSLIPGAQMGSAL